MTKRKCFGEILMASMKANVKCTVRNAAIQFAIGTAVSVIMGGVAAANHKAPGVEAASPKSEKKVVLTHLLFFSTQQKTFTLRGDNFENRKYRPSWRMLQHDENTVSIL